MTTPAAAPRPGTLAAAFDPRDNALDAIRLALAAVVAATHALQLARGWQPVVGSTEVGALAVDAFFVISGFLVTRSFLRTRSWRRFTWHRFLRIVPGAWACLLVTGLVVAPLAAWLTGAPPAGVLTSGDSPAWRYVLAGLPLLVTQFDISGIGPGGGGSFVANGSLWTLGYEVGCYALVAGLGALGVLRRAPWLVVAAATLTWLVVVGNDAGLALVGQERALRLVLVFLLGAAGHLLAHRVPTGWPWVLASTAVLVPALLLLPDHRVLGALPFAHLVLVAAARLPLRWPLRADLSYGVYIYHWPLLQLLVLGGVTAVLPTAVVVGLALALACGAAALSWHLVEAPALRLRDAGWVEGRPRRRRPGAPREIDLRGADGGRPTTPERPRAPGRPTTPAHRATREGVVPPR